MFYSHPESDGKIVRRWGWGSNADNKTRSGKDIPADELVPFIIRLAA